MQKATPSRFDIRCQRAPISEPKALASSDALAGELRRAGRNHCRRVKLIRPDFADLAVAETEQFAQVRSLQFRVCKRE